MLQQKQGIVNSFSVRPPASINFYFVLFLFALYLSEVEAGSTLWLLQLAVMSPVSESPRRAQQTTQLHIKHGDQTPTQTQQTSQLNVPHWVLLC